MSNAGIVATLMTLPDLQLVSNTVRVEASLCSVRLSDADPIDPERRCNFYLIITLFSISDLSDMSLREIYRPILQRL